MITLSIIIPVYKGEKFIQKCLDSIFYPSRQLDLFEVIIINDGTPDNSLEIISDYTKLFNNITLFSQENMGLGEARNTGIKLAKGEYIWFVDQDDWITPNAIERICKLVDSNKPEILFFEYTYPLGNKSTIINKGISGQTYSGIEFLNIHMVENPVWQYVIKTSLMLKYKLSFHSDYHEDSLFTPIAIFLAQSVLYDNNVNYIYNLREDSITTSAAPLKHCHDIIKVVEKLHLFIINHSKTTVEKKIFTKYISLAFSGLFYYWKQLSNQDKNKISKSLPMEILFNAILYNFNFKHLIILIIIKIK